jgi:hypothetical protein
MVQPILDESDGATPRISLVQQTVERTEAPGWWKIIWLVGNIGSVNIAISSARLPHGQFKAEEQRFDPAIELEPGATSEFSTAVYCHERPGLVTENAFLIFYLMCLERPWRIFARLEIVVDPGGEPRATAALITNQRVGFSGVAD